MLPSFVALLFLSLVETGFGQQHHLGFHHKEKPYNITLDFDDLPTNSSGVGFHPTNPKEDAFEYKSIYLQTFTLMNASSANLTKIDTHCSKSWPNSIFGSRKDGYAWPRISLHDLSKPRSELADDVRKSDRTFSLVSVHMKPTGNITGSPDETIGTISFTMMRLDPDPRKKPIPPEAGYPGIVRGSPLPLFIGNVTGVSVFFPPGAHEGFTLNPKQFFGPEFGNGVDVMEVTSQVFRKQKDAPYFEPAEDWEVCLDNVILEITEKDSSKPITPVQTSWGVKADGSKVRRNDTEWEVMSQLTCGPDTSF